MITVHHLEHSRSQRVLWLLEELGLEYELKVYARNPKTMRAPPELKRLHPLGRAPQVEADGHVLAESGAILEYFVEREGKLRPTDPAERVRYRYWLHYAEGSAMPPLLVKLITNQLRTKPPALVRLLTSKIADQVDGAFTDRELRAHFGWVEQALGEHPWFAGEDFSAADIQMSYPVQASLERGGLGARPHTEAWFQRVQARPAWERAVEVGGAAIPPGA